jgi:predicted acetyltransferase
MEVINYTLANETHIPIIIALRIRFLLEFGGPQSQEAQDTLKKELHVYFEKHLKNRTYICWIATVNDAVAGIGGMTMREHPGNFKNLSGKMGYVINMYTAPEFRKRGICATILDRLQETAATMGVYSYELHATKEGEPVYVKNGFEMHHEPTYRKLDKDHFKD